MNWQTVTRDLGWHFKTLQHIFINVACKQETKRSTVKYFIVPAFKTLEWQKQLCS